MGFLIGSLFFGGFCGVVAWKQDYTPSFTQGQIERTKELRKVSEYNTYCKEAASKGIYSDEQLIFKEYFDKVGDGFVRSINRFGNKCWYNSKVDVELDLHSFT